MSEQELAKTTIDTTKTNRFGNILSLTSGERGVLLTGLVVTAGFLIAALVGELKDWPDFAVDCCRELAIFAFTITAFESFKDVYLRDEIEAEKKSLLDDCVARITEELERKNRLANYGIEDALIPFDANMLMEIISKLSAGDCLYCHDGSIPDFEDVKSLIVERAMQGVRFRFMFVAPFCMNAKRRALELEKSDIEYSNRCKEFGDSIEKIREQIRKACNNKPNTAEIVDYVQLRYFRSLLSIPFYLLEKGDSGSAFAQAQQTPQAGSLITKAWTGFYLKKSSSSFIFIQWRHNEEAQSTGKRDMKSSDMISTLKQYWDFKWNESYVEYQESALWLGQWRYVCIDETISEDPVYMGVCNVTEKSGRLDAITTRNKTCKGSEQCETIFIRWTNEEDDGDLIHKYRNGKDNFLFLALSYRPEKPGPRRASATSPGAADPMNEDVPCIKSFVRLRAVKTSRFEGGVLKEGADELDIDCYLEGNYYVVFSDESQRRPEIFPSTCGTIRLYRDPDRSRPFG